MFYGLIVFVILATAPALTKVVKDFNSCSHNEFPCDDGACVSLDRVCNGFSDCADRSDEFHCEVGLANRRTRNLTLSRSKRQKTCRETQFQCTDGTCIPFDEICDGLINCPDKSDEMYALCRNLQCQENWFKCSYGACVDGTAPCNGIQDCADNSDELLLRCRNDTDQIDADRRLGNLTLNRPKRQASSVQTTCRKTQFRCRDGTCIPFDGRCDGLINCPDRSDETHALCRNSQCQENWFRCTYGACVDGTAPCNGIQECADNSDELLSRCRNETDEIKGRFKCLDGSTIPAWNHCDGEVNCPDGSDETVRACADKTCSTHLFQCAYGACVDQGSDCNEIKDCADGSDEDDELCGREVTTTTTEKAPSATDCVLPPYPERGIYEAAQAPNASPGQVFDYAQLTYSCQPGFGVVGTKVVTCINGLWNPTKMPECVRFCKLAKDPSVIYRCLIKGGQDAQGDRNCNDQEPIGTSVRPVCNSPNYYNTGLLPNMKCFEDGSWDYVATCLPECGRITPGGSTLIIDGWAAKKGELPWHVGIYRKTTTPFMQICGGSIIKNDVVISAAHCFWSDVEKRLPAANYAVAAGKLYRPWNDPMDMDVQKSDVRDIKIPSRFQGNSANFQDDIALVYLTSPFEYRVYVRPVCMDFDVVFDRTQLEAGTGKQGKVAGWGVTGTGKSSPILLTVTLPNVNIEECIAKVPPEFREYITSDKICAGYQNGTALCKGDSGGGLAYPESDRGTIRYYLRGIVSTAATNGTACNAFVYTTFTQILKHEHFIKEFL